MRYQVNEVVKVRDGLRAGMIGKVFSVRPEAIYPYGVLFNEGTFLFKEDELDPHLEEVYQTTGTPAYVIWWLSQEDFEYIRDQDIEHLPEWLQSQFQSAMGRNGRGRLWMDPAFGRFAVDFGTGPIPMVKLCSQRAGLVINRSDTPLLAKLPGIVTDGNLQRV